MAGSWAGFLGDLHNFWVEQLTAAQICENPGLNNPLMGNIAQIRLGELASRIAQS